MDRYRLLIEENLGLVNACLSRVRPETRRLIGTEELRAAGNLALVESAHRYEPDRGAFSTLAWPRITGAMTEACYRNNPLGEKAARRKLRPEGRNARWALRPAAKQTLTDVIPCRLPSSQEKAHIQELQRRVRFEVELLPIRLRLILFLRYWRGAPLSVAAQLLGVSCSRICQLHRRALGLLRPRLSRLESIL